MASESEEFIWICVAITSIESGLWSCGVSRFDSPRQGFPQNDSFLGPSNSSIPREVSLETIPFLQKILIFGVPQNSSIPREGPLETVRKVDHFAQNGSIFGPFLTALHEGWNRFEWPENGPFLGQISATDRHTDTQTDRQTLDEHQNRDVTLISRTGSTIAPFGGN